LRPSGARGGEKASRKGYFTALAPDRDGGAASHGPGRDRAAAGRVW